MPPHPSDRERDVRSLQRLTARIVKHDDMLDVKCWEQIEQGLKSVLGHILPSDEVGWTSSPAGHAALECMQAIVERAPAAMRAVTSSQQEQRGHLDILVVPHAVCTVFLQFTEDVKFKATLSAVWPTGYQSSASALAKVAVLLPQAALDDPDIMPLILFAFQSLRSGHVDLPLTEKVDLILVQV